LGADSEEISLAPPLRGIAVFSLANPNRCGNLVGRRTVSKISRHIYAILRTNMADGMAVPVAIKAVAASLFATNEQSP
jgi:hypothetical protein